MVHHLSHPRSGTVLFRTDEEARNLWNRLRDLPGLIAACIMPDHLHNQNREDVSEALRHVLTGYARWRNEHRGESGPVWEPSPPPTLIADERHGRRTTRYIHLNPCRDGHTGDPLAWAWSTHRDMVGLAADPIVPKVRDPVAFHAYVSADPSVKVAGTPFPEFDGSPVAWADIVDATCAVFRTLPDELLQRGDARTAAVRAAFVHGMDNHDVLARLAGCGRSTVSRLVAGLRVGDHQGLDPATGAVVRVVHDRRFAALSRGQQRFTRRRD